MKNKTKTNLILLLIGGAVIWWYLPTIGNLAAMRPAPQPAQYIAPQPIYKEPATQPLFVAPAPSGGEAAAQPVYNEPAPTAVIIMQPILSSPTIEPAPQPTAVIIIQEPEAADPPKDWTNEITAVNKNLESAITLVEVCAKAKVEAALEFPIPRIVNCSPVVENLERAKGKVEELQQAIRESNQ